jgi:phosphate-selective porin OprO/OprP
MRWVRSIVGVLTICAGAGLAEAQESFRSPQDVQILFEEPPPSPPEIAPVVPPRGESAGNLTDELQRLRERLEVLERAEDERAKKEGAANASSGKTNGKQQDSLWTDVSDEKWTVKLGGDVQMDSVNWAYADPAITGPAANPGARDYFEFRRLRLMAEGTGYGVYDFRLQMSMEPDTTGDTQIIPAGGGQLLPSTPAVKDAYFSINEVPWLGRVRIGNFFVPFGLEQVTNDRFTVFLERSIPTQGVFTPDRQVGVAMYNTNDAQNVTWSFGTFYDNISETQKSKIDNNQGIRVSGRVTWLPYYDEPSNGRYLVHTGAGVLYTDQYNHTVVFRTRPEIHQGPRLIDSGPLDAQSYTTGNIEGAIVWGPFALQTEGYVTSVNIAGGDGAIFHGAYVHVTYFLTGEHRHYERFGQHGAQFGRPAPFSNVFFTPGGCGWGGWQAKARWSYLSLDAVNKGRIDDITIGMNWLWSDRTRVLFDYIHTMTSRQTTFGATQSDIIGMRFDFNW